MNASAGKIVFLNEPKLSEYERDSEFNERRTALIPEIKAFLEGHPLFTDVPVNVTFTHQGISSLVSILEAPAQKLVLKIPLDIKSSREEGTFLKIWEKSGVAVPHILEEGEIGQHFYMLMEFIDAPTLNRSHSIEELIERKVYRDMGKVLKQMHATKAQGHGKLINGVAEYPNLTTFLANDAYYKEKVEYISENEILNDREHGSLEMVYEILMPAIGHTTESAYCHNDFTIGNIFATEPLTVFDPMAFVNHPLMDVGRTIILGVRMGISDVSAQVIEGYFVGEEVDRRLLQAAIVLNVYMKFKYWHQTHRTGDIENIKRYLAETRHFLDG